MNYFDAKQEVQISQKKIKQLKQTQNTVISPRILGYLKVNGYTVGATLFFSFLPPL